MQIYLVAQHIGQGQLLLVSKNQSRAQEVMGIKYTVTGCIYDKPRMQRCDKPVTCSLPLYFDTRKLFIAIAQFRQCECLGLAPGEVLSSWIGIPKRIHSRARCDGMLVMQQRARARSNAGGERF